MNKVFLICVIFLVVGCKNNGDAELSGVIDNSPITVKTCNHDSGAICGIEWRNQQYIDDYDHGRQAQSAASFDHKGESYNPTEAGANYLIDGINPSPSSSELEWLYQADNTIITKSQMAYWKKVDSETLSDFVLVKSVTIGYESPDGIKLDNVLIYTAQFTDTGEKPHSFGQFEVLTGYMPPAFSEFYTYNPDTSDLQTLSDGPGEQKLPIIFSTESGSHAIGIFNPEVPQAKYPNAGYGRWRYARENVVKWNTVQRYEWPKAVNNFRVFMIIGTLSTVQTNMTQLYMVLK